MAGKGRPKGSPKVGGRRPGSTNKRTAELLDRLNGYDQDPFDILFAFARGDWKALGYENELTFKEGPEGEIKMGFVIPPELRAKTAKDACEYLYPKRSSVTLSVDKLSDQELFGEAERRLNKEDEDDEK